MIGKLLKMHGINYIISVDDCYSITNDIEFVRATIFATLASSANSIDSALEELGEKDLWDSFRAMIIPGQDATTVYYGFMDALGDDKLLALYEKMEVQNRNSDFMEKNRLIAFLNKIKENGYIEGYFTYPSTKTAMEEYLKLDISTSGILWLIDNNFARVGESSDAGMTLAQNIIEKDQGSTSNYVFILSSLTEPGEKSEDDIESEFDTLLQGKYTLKTASFIYYLYKQRIDADKMDRISKSLAQGFKRKVCYQLFDNYACCLRKSIECTEKSLYNIKQDTLNYLFAKRVPEESESFWEFLIRFVNLFMSDEYKKALTEAYPELVSLITYYKEISQIISSTTANEANETVIAKIMRKRELYDFSVNDLHSEVTTGDIFLIGDKYYLLVSQACDSCLRVDGKRVLENATLLLIKNEETGPETFRHDLKVSFVEGSSKASVYLKEILTLSFDILDLCVLNKDGTSAIGLDRTLEELLGESAFYEDRYKKRIEEVQSCLYRVVHNNQLLDCFFEDSSAGLNEEIIAAYKESKTVKPELLAHTIIKGQAVFDVRRVCRLQELVAIDIVRKYGNVVSRIGHSFDFASKTSRSEAKKK